MTRIATCILLALLLGGCGYQFSPPDGSGALSRPGIASIAVPAFTSVAFQQGDELRLSRALVQSIETRTSMKVMDRSRADTILEGHIRSIGSGNVSRDSRAAIPQEQVYLVTLDFTWKDLRDGRVLVERRNFQHAVSYFPTLGEGRFLASEQVAQEIAAAIVNELVSEW